MYNQTHFFPQNYYGQTTVLRQSDSFSKKGKLNFKGGIFSPFWDDIQNAALRDGKYARQIGRLGVNYKINQRRRFSIPGIELVAQMFSEPYLKISHYD